MSNIAITTISLRGQQRTYFGAKTPEFAHDQHQLIVSAEGAFTVNNNFGAWTVPAGCAAWVPARQRHAIQALPRALTRVLYLSTGPADTAVMAVSPLVRAIVDHVCDAERPLDAASGKRLLAVLLDQLPHQRQVPLFVPVLTSPLARKVAEALRADPADTPRIRDLAAELGVSTRTLERAFEADARMAFGEWRQRWRLCRAIAMLADGMAVRDVALEVGYETASAFVATFKKYVGMTPGKLAAVRAPGQRP